MQRLTKPMVEVMTTLRDQSPPPTQYPLEQLMALNSLRKRGLVVQRELTPSGHQALKEHLKKGT